MKTVFIPIGLLTAAVVFGAGVTQAQEFLDGGAVASVNGEPAAGASASSLSFADGTRAINQRRWQDAISIFSELAEGRGDYADGALYWKAYAQNKLGNSPQALETCTALLHQYPVSTWVEDCGALKIEIHAKNGEPIAPSAEQSDNLKLLALASLMHHDERRALDEINDILNGDSSEKLKQGALFIMGAHHSGAIYPQIVRISYVEGDVRVSREAEENQSKSSDWEQAIANLPLETGYSLVTGKGRAEIEFENDSMLYLGEDSVLLFNDLHTTNGVPYTEVALLSGTATLHIFPSVPGEWFMLKTPTDALSTRYPNANNFRVNSYMDGIGLTPLVASDLITTGTNAEAMTPGKTVYYKEGKPILEAGPIHPPDYTSWDNWVQTRYAERQKETAAALKASGLGSPIPGMADLAQEGSFFSCEPYGTCWTPSAPQNPATGNTLVASGAGRAEPPSQTEILPSDVQPAAPGSKIGFLGKPMLNSSPQTNSAFADIDFMFPCMPNEVRFLLMGNTLSASALTQNSSLWYYGQPWQWAVCHAGSWIYQKNRYVWVAGRSIHRLPVRWVKTGHAIGFVPIHPYDIKGRTPLNSKNGLFAVDSKSVHPIETLALDPGRKVEILNEPPKELRADFVSPLAHAAEPKMTAHEIKGLSVARGSLSKASGIPITFDQRSRTFMASHEVMQGSRGVTVMEPIGGRGSGLQSRGYYGGGGASSGAGGWRAGSSASPSANGGAGWHGGYSAGGGARGGSQGGNSGGGYHGGGGSTSSGSTSGGSSSGTGSSAGSGSGSSASSGGSAHH